MTKDVTVTVEFSATINIDDDVYDDEMIEEQIQEQVGNIIETSLESERNVSFVDILSIKEN